MWIDALTQKVREGSRRHCALPGRHRHERGRLPGGPRRRRDQQRGRRWLAFLRSLVAPRPPRRNPRPGTARRWPAHREDRRPGAGQARRDERDAGDGRTMGEVATGCRATPPAGSPALTARKSSSSLTASASIPAQQISTASGRPSSAHYTFQPPGISGKAEGLARAYASGVVCTDEWLLHPDPYPSREDWCRARVEFTQRRLKGRDLAMPVILVNHFPLVRQPTEVLHYPQFADGGGVIPGQCLRLVPALACAAGSCPAGCEARGKAQGPSFRPGVTGEGNGREGRMPVNPC